MRRRRARAMASAGLVAGAIILSSATWTVAAPDPEEAAKALQRRAGFGITFTLASEADEELARSSGVSADEAIAVATSRERRGHNPVALLGRWTDRVQESAPDVLAHVNRLVYVVLLERVPFVVSGGRPRMEAPRPAPQPVLMDVAFLVDVITGEPLMSMTLGTSGTARRPDR